ncbi:MAG: 30S ribosomal protein S6e [Infirmifilum sp.]|jgi:small subunit ribosomal protein S6e|uniref:Small ribosomal subunit protein eS6 n=1 Tax=Infirmifilum uzonense TaxID=1550241 RepID=A0A0F7FJF6_9CREN|nr:30S ribosomal protein S6e [Infirmifilum uzonense]AKG39159.1 30S ribosomal protein S6 [Infirmifilum uzonense]
MPEFKLVISDPTTGKAEQIELKGDQASRLIGYKIGDIIDGGLIGRPGVKLQIRGGSGRAGEPMRPDIPGARKGYFLLSGPPGYKPKEKGERRRRYVRGNTITDDVVQINLVIIEGSQASAQQS